MYWPFWFTGALGGSLYSSSRSAPILMNFLLIPFLQEKLSCTCFS